MKVAVLAYVLLFSMVRSEQRLGAHNFINAINYARINPFGYAFLIEEWFTSKGTKGTANDPDCYTEAEAFLRGQGSLPMLTENLAADLAAWRHSKWMKETATFSHTGLDGSTPMSRLEAVGTWATENTKNFELIRWHTALGSPTDYLLQWITDCGDPGRPHRAQIFSTAVTQIGCAFYDDYVTCIGTQPIKLQAAVTDADLTEAGLTKEANGVGYTGNEGE